MDSLQIVGLTISTRIGVHAWEQQILQPLLIDLTIPSDFKGYEDNIEKALDYDRLCQAISHYIESNSFYLIETVAEKTAQFIKEQFNINQLTLSVSKPQAIANATNIRVTITR